MPAGKHDESSAATRFGSKGRVVRLPLLVIGFMLLGAAIVTLLYGTGALGPGEATSSTLDQIVPVEPGTPQLLEAVPPAGTGNPAIGNSAPSFTVPDIDGNWTSIADYQGQPLLINFWATWCGPCIVEMPELQSAYERYRDEGLVVLGLNRDEDVAQIREFLVNSLETDVSFPILVDEHAVIADRYQVFNLPTTFVVNRDGVITAIHRGPLTQSQIEAYIADM